MTALRGIPILLRRLQPVPGCDDHAAGHVRHLLSVRASRCPGPGAGAKTMTQSRASRSCPCPRVTGGAPRVTQKSGTSSGYPTKHGGRPLDNLGTALYFRRGSPEAIEVVITS